LLASAWLFPSLPLPFSAGYLTNGLLRALTAPLFRNPPPFRFPFPTFRRPLLIIQNGPCVASFCLGECPVSPLADYLFRPIRRITFMTALALLRRPSSLAIPFSPPSSGLRKIALPTSSLRQKHCPLQTEDRSHLPLIPGHSPPPPLFRILLTRSLPAVQTGFDPLA